MAGEWRELTLAQALTVLVRFASIGKSPYFADLFIRNWPTRVRALRPSFYPAALLVEVQVEIEGGQIGLCNFLYGDERVALIDGDSAGIHTFNESEGLSLTTTEVAADYLRFFCSAVHGEEGRFRVVEIANELPPGVEVGETTVGPVSVRKAESGFVAEATLQYGTGLYASTFSISPNGLVMMTEDRPLCSLPGEPERFLVPFRVVA